MVLPKMQEILQKDRELTELVEDIRSADAGTVRLGAFTSVAVHWLPGMIRTFQSAHPKAELKMFNGDYHDMEQWLREGEVDLGFVTLPAPEGMRTIPLTQDPLVAIMPKNHRLAQLDEIPIQELGEDPFISLLQSSAHDIHRALDNAGVRPNIKFTTKDDYAILAMVEQGLGISIVPQLLIQGRTQNLAPGKPDDRPGHPGGKASACGRSVCPDGGGMGKRTEREITTFVLEDTENEHDFCTRRGFRYFTDSGGLRAAGYDSGHCPPRQGAHQRYLLRIVPYPRGRHCPIDIAGAVPGRVSPS